MRAALGAGRGRLVRQLMTEALVLGAAGGAARPARRVCRHGRARGRTSGGHPAPRQHRRQPARWCSSRFAISAPDGFDFRRRASLAGDRAGAPHGHAAGHAERRRHFVRASRARRAGRGRDGAGGRPLDRRGPPRPQFCGDDAGVAGFPRRTGHDVSHHVAGPGLRRRARNCARGSTRSRPGCDRCPASPSTGVSTVLPLSGLGSMLGFAVEGAPPPPSNVNPEIAVASVSPGYFDAIGATVQRGRTFAVARYRPTRRGSR